MDTGASLIGAGPELTRTLWQRDLGRALESPPGWVDGTWVTAPAEGALVRLDGATGREIWKSKLPATPVGSPFVSGDVVVVVTDAPAGAVLGYRLADGEKLWTWNRALGMGARRDSVFVLAARGGRVVRIDPETGAERWTARCPGAGWKPPCIVRDAVVVPVRPDSLVALSLADGKRVWGQRVGAWPATAATDGLLLAVTDDSTAVLLHAESGVVITRRSLASLSAGPPVWDGDRVFVSLRKGTVLALDGNTLETLWARDLDPPLVSPPFPSGNRVLQSGPRGLVYALDGGTGESVGVYRHPEPLVVSPAGADDLLAVGGDDGTLVVYRREP
jgi:outer membrane protein assembly factor BamB